MSEQNNLNPPVVDENVSPVKGNSKSFSKLVLVVAGVAFVLVAAIGATVGVLLSSESTGGGGQQRSVCETISEDRKQAFRNAIAETIFVDNDLAGEITNHRIVVSGTNIPCLPNNAFSELDQDNFFSIDGKPTHTSIGLNVIGLKDVETNAFANFQAIEVADTVSIDFSSNELVTVRDDIFQIFKGQTTLQTISFSKNSIESLNSTLFEGVTVNNIILDENIPLTKLPKFEAIENSFVSIFCIFCRQLNEIEADYCEDVLRIPNSGERVSLILEDTALADNLVSADDLANITGCLASNIELGNEEEVEKQEIRQSIADNIEITVEETEVTLSMNGFDLDFLPSGALALVNLPQLPTGFHDLVLDFSNCNLNSIEGDAFDDETMDDLLFNSDKIFMILSENKLEALPDNVFSPFSNKQLFSVDLSENSFQSLDNSEEIFFTQLVSELDFSFNNFIALPELRVIRSSEIVVKCEGCEDLTTIESSYCFNIYNLSGGPVTLDLTNTTIANNLEKAEIATLTSCLEENIIV